MSIINDLYLDFGHVSLNKKGESLCGDFYNVVTGQNEVTVVLSDGLGSGVKANILATLTAQVLSTMMSKKMPIEDAILTIADTLPVCKVRNLSYSTFTVMHIVDSIVELIQFDNPNAIILRKGKNLDYDIESKIISDKEINESKVEILIDDMIILMSDGVTNAGLGKTTIGGWGREDVLAFCERFYTPNMSAQEMAAHVAAACVSLNLNETDDDISALVFKIKERYTVNIIMGPPKSQEDDSGIMENFFCQKGIHVACGGTTAGIVSRYLKEELKTIPDSSIDGIPGRWYIKGLDLVTEGIVTLEKLVEYAQYYIEDELAVLELIKKEDAAAILANILFEKATDINILLGSAANIGNQNLNLGFEEKHRLIKVLERCLEKMGKNVKIKIC